MGNHEFCTECHESDFHYGRPCDPAKRAKVVAQEEAAEKQRKINEQKLRVLADWLYGLGLDVNVGGCYTTQVETVEIASYDLTKVNVEKLIKNAATPGYKPRKRKKVKDTGYDDGWW
jgi:hypothetical protein